MTTTLSREQFFQNLSDSQLLTPQEVGKLRDTIPAAQASSGTAVAQELVSMGRLTSFQAEAICERRLEGLLIGNYEVLDRLGQGGMGTVYKARHKRMRRVVAIKVLSRDVAKAEQFTKRFQREVEAVARLSHPNIVMAHDADEAEVGHYLVMEFVNGRDLASTVQKQGRLSVREALDCTIQAAHALEYAHKQGITHRDIKPANLLRDAEGVVKVADLGLARFDESLVPASGGASALTQAGTIMGTVDYMSPEQALGADSIDHRTDIYSLGCTLYFLLMGEPPFKGASLMAVLLKHRDAPIPSLRQVRPELPAELDAVFRRMLAKSPADRYQTMAEVLHALGSVEETLREHSGTDISFDEQPASMSAGQSQPWANENTFLAAPTSASSQTIEQSPATALQKLRVLLVEPSRTQSAIIRKYLQTSGVQQVLAASTGQEAIEVVRREQPDIVLSALHLSDMAGVQLAEQLQKKGPKPPGFLLISSEAERADSVSLSNCGNTVVLKKPFTAAQLVDALKLVSPEQPSSPAPSIYRTLRALIVDDSAAARLHIKGVLARLGLTQFTEATDGAHAVAILAGQNFDLVVTDYNMPHMDGLGLVGYLKQNPTTASTPIIMVTTENDPGKLEAIRQLGVEAICEKRFPSEIARQVLEKLVKAP